MPKRPKLTEDLIELLCDALDVPMTLEDACRFVGLSSKQVERWMDAADDEDCDDELLLLLSRRISETMAGAQSKRGELMSMAYAMAAADPKVALQLLATLNPSLNPTRKVKVDATVTPKAPRLDLSKLTAEELAKLEESDKIMAKLRSGD